MNSRALLPLSLVVLLACVAESRPATRAAAPPTAPAPRAAVTEVQRVTPDAPFRQQAPTPGPEPAFVPPAIQSFRLKNGVRVLLTERHELPIVSVRVVVGAGAGDLPKEPPGLLSFLGSMLEQGTAKKSALEISDAFESIGAAHNAWVDWDSAGASVKVTADKLEAALGLLSEVVMHPAFPQAEIDRLKARRLASLQQEKNNVSSMWSNATAAVLYGRSHPYGNSLYGRPENVPNVTRAELVKVHAAIFTPSLAAILVAGDVTNGDLSDKLEKAFGGWRGAPATTAVPKLPSGPRGEARVVWVDKPGAPQSLVRLAEIGVPRLAPDRDAILVMNTILGGMFSSRINLNLREAHAFTYGASSSFQMRHGSGYFSVGGSIVADKTAPAITEIFNEVRAMRDRLVSDAELENAKQNIKRAMPGRFEAVSEVTGALADIAVFGLPLDEFAARPARIDKVTADDVMKAARAHLHPDTLEIIVVGDRKKLEPTLETLQLGAIEELDAYGDPLGKPKGP